MSDFKGFLPASIELSAPAQNSRPNAIAMQIDLLDNKNTRIPSKSDIVSFVGYPGFVADIEKKDNMLLCRVMCRDSDTLTGLAEAMRKCKTDSLLAEVKESTFAEGSYIPTLAAIKNAYC